MLIFFFSVHIIKMLVNLVLSKRSVISKFSIVSECSVISKFISISMYSILFECSVISKFFIVSEYSILSKFSICIIIPVCRNDVLSSKGSARVPERFQKVKYRR